MTAWNKEEAIEQIKHGGRFGHKRVMEKVYKHNCELFGLWADGLPTGVPGGLGDRAALLNGTKVYSRPFSVADVPTCGVETKTGCVNADCMDVAEQMLAQGLRPAILNLASRRHPCGGYHRATSAQEESLSRASTLSPSLYQYFDATKACVRAARVPARYNAYPLDIEFGGIYSPDVCFFRAGKGEGYAFREKPFKCGVVTVAALSFREPNSYCNEERQFMAPGGGFTEVGERIQLNKVRTIYRLALKNGHDSVILGAFGCGVNKLPCDAVARQFKSVLAEPEFAGKFKAVCFAILENRGNAAHPVGEVGKFAPFYAAFGKWTL